MSGYTSNQNFGEMTAHGLNNNPNRKISTTKACEILADASRCGVRAVQFTGGGEPTVHPAHIEIFRHALKLGLECSLVTNGALLRPDWEEVYGKFSWIRVSLDAGTEETYRKIRKTPKGSFDRALKNIGKLASLDGPYVGVSYVVTKENWTEIYEATRLSGQSGASYIRFAAMFSPDGSSYYESLIDDIKHQIGEAEFTKGIKVINMFDCRLEDLELESPDYQYCGYQYFNVYIGGDLKVYRCCNTAYNDKGYVGDLKEQSFESFLRSPEVDSAYSSFNAKSCERCAFNQKNKIINYMLDPAPTHVEFA